jgi:hypothetical protein
MFSRCLTAGIASIGLLVGVEWYRGRDAVPEAGSGFTRVNVDQQPDIPEELRQRWQTLDEQAQRRNAFRLFEARLMAALLHKETSLRDATERMFYYCLEHYPEHLENVSNAERGPHIKTKVAQNIVRYLEMRHATTEGEPDVVGYYSCELSALPYEEHTAPPASH